LKTFFLLPVSTRPSTSLRRSSGATLTTRADTTLLIHFPSGICPVAARCSSRLLLFLFLFPFRCEQVHARLGQVLLLLLVLVLRQHLGLLLHARQRTAHVGVHGKRRPLLRRQTAPVVEGAGDAFDRVRGRGRVHPDMLRGPHGNDFDGLMADECTKMREQTVVPPHLCEAGSGLDARQWRTVQDSAADSCCSHSAPGTSGSCGAAPLHNPHARLSRAGACSRAPP